jgi:hypothetical protein
MNDTWAEVTKLMEARAARTDVEILAEFEALAPLDERSATSEDAFWEHAVMYLALTEICAERRLKPGARWILEKAEFGDPGSIMRGIRHALERIYNPDWAGLAQVCIDAFKTGRPGTQVWAMSELRILEQPFARAVFEDVLQRREVEYVSDAEQGIARLDVIIEKAKREGKSDADILAELAGIPPLIDEVDPAWTTGIYWTSEAWKAASVFGALTEIATARQLKAAVPLLFDKACLGNPRGLMSGLHYNVAHIVGDDWLFLQAAAHKATQSPHPGTRYWALKELGWGVISSYDYPPAREVFLSFVASGPEDLRAEAEGSLYLLAEREREKLSPPPPTGNP